MAEKDGHAPGTPSWVDLGTPDPQGSRAFYEGLFGWTSRRMDEPEAGGYTMFLHRGRAVAGMGPLTQEGQPHAWSTYITVADAEATARRAREAGATVLVEPMDVLKAGRMAVLSDPQGAVVCLWQAGEHRGAGLVNEPGALAWNELATRDVEASKRFYNAVFGWAAVTSPMGETSYTEFQLDGTSIAGMLEMGEAMAQVPPHWLPYFAVDDCDVAVVKAEELGGTVRVPPADIEPGRFAVLADPHGASFAVIRISPPPTRQDARS